MKQPTLVIPPAEYDLLIKHLVRVNPKSEEAAFVFTTAVGSILTWSETYLVPKRQFAHRSLYHIELTDECRRETIKRAHDLGAGIVEFHSHPLSKTACFSPSDRSGFEEYVPHVMWRLKNRPYGAVVVGPSNFDSLYWDADPLVPTGTLAIQVGGQVLLPTCETTACSQHWSGYDW